MSKRVRCVLQWELVRERRVAEQGVKDGPEQVGALTVDVEVWRARYDNRK